jgi:hypothetical protein
VLYFHTTNILTRYSESELKELKESKQSQAPPACMYQPNIIKLNILKFKSDHPKSYEEECENFREKLHNLSLSSWDPKFLELLQNYNNGYYETTNQQPAARPVQFPAPNVQQQNLNCNNRRTSNFFQQPPPQVQVQAPAQQRRHVSWNNRIDERIIDKRQGNYQDRNVRSGYFDGIQSQGRPNQNQNQGNWNQSAGRYRYQQYYNNEPKLNAFQQPRNDPGFNPISQNSSGNSLDKDNSKETSMESKKTDDSETKKDGHLADDEEEEPEWFAMPVSRLDTIELRGFDDDVSTTTNGDDDSERAIVGKGIPPARSTPTKRRDFRFDEFSNHRGSSQNAVSIFS